MPTTEAGKRLLDDIKHGRVYGAEHAAVADIDAIEAEAVAAMEAKTVAAFRAIEVEARAAERERIRLGVERIATSGGGFLDVLRIIDGEDSDPHQITCNRCGVSMDRSDDERHDCTEAISG